MSSFYQILLQNSLSHRRTAWLTFPNFLPFGLSRFLWARSCWISHLVWACSLCFSLTTSLKAAPGPFGVIFPGDTSAPGPTNTSPFVTFLWGTSSGALSYYLNVRDLTAPGQPVTSYPANGTTYSLTLTPEHSYKWNVLAYTGA